MAFVNPALFSVLYDPPVEAKLIELYRATVKQAPFLILYFLPKLPKVWFGKGLDWKGENEAFFDDKYSPIHPTQGTFIYRQARALQAKNSLELGTSYGISTLYLAKAAKDNSGKVISTEYLSHTVKAARRHSAEAGLADYVTILEGDARQTLQALNDSFDLVLLDGFPNLVFPIFKLIEACLQKGALLLVGDVEGYQPAMQNYLNYVRNPTNGYLSTI